jgi:hypothetical protein
MISALIQLTILLWTFFVIFNSMILTAEIHQEYMADFHQLTKELVHENREKIGFKDNLGFQSKR